MSDHMQVKQAADAVVAANIAYEAAVVAWDAKVAAAANMVDANLAGAYLAAVNAANEAVDLQASELALINAEEARQTAIDNLKSVTSEYDGT